MVDFLLLAYGALCKHIRFSFQSTVFVYDFQRAKQTIRGIVRESHVVSSAVDEPVFGGEVVVKRVERFLFLLDHFIGITLKLILNQSSGAVPQADHALNAILRSYR